MVIVMIIQNLFCPDFYRNGDRSKNDDKFQKVHSKLSLFVFHKRWQNQHDTFPRKNFNILIKVLKLSAQPSPLNLSLLTFLIDDNFTELIKNYWLSVPKALLYFTYISGKPWLNFLFTFQEIPTMYLQYKQLNEVTQFVEWRKKFFWLGKSPKYERIRNNQFVLSFLTSSLKWRIAKLVGFNVPV